VPSVKQLTIYFFSFDICFLNDIAVANSGLLREYSLVDPRVRTLMMSVKQWAKEFGINSAKDNHISSYTWMNLVVFYLQCIRFLPNLQSPALMEAVGLVPDPNDNYWHFVNNLDTCTLSWDAVRKANEWIMPSELDYVPLPALLYGFFEFYGFRFPWTSAVSIKQGDIVVSKLATGKVCAFFSIEDPFETYDSHCPHDLGTPCSENGSSYIMHCLRDAERHLKGVLSGDGANTEKLWPKGPALEPEPKAVNTKQQQVWKSFDNPGRKSDKGTDNGKSTPKKSAQGGRPRSKQGGGAPGNEKRSPIKESKGDDDRSKQQGGQSQKQGKPKKDQQQQKKGQEGGSNKKSGSTGKRRGGRNYRRGGRGGQPPSGGTAETNHW
jgi:senataxin/terminal uridylyltransferase